MGVSFKIPHKLNGQIMAFGAGALLFAVSIEMFAAGRAGFLSNTRTKKPEALEQPLTIVDAASSSSPSSYLFPTETLPFP